MAVLGLAYAFAPTAWASPISSACTALGNARTALSLMVIAPDKPAQQALDVKVQASSAKLDALLAEMTGSNAKVATEVAAVWNRFKATREKKIIPAIYKGDADEASRIAHGIQYVRLSKMWKLMSCK